MTLAFLQISMEEGLSGGLSSATFLNNNMDCIKVGKVQSYIFSDTTFCTDGR
jgi:hypothetical protein